MQQLVNIFDLDCTLIDSSHRINQYGDQSKGLDIDYWIENNTHDNIMKDKLLPLAELCKEFQKTQFTNIAVTARNMTFSDFLFLEQNGLNFNMVLHRENSKDLDHILKEKKLKELFDTGNYIPFLAFDDKEDNLEIFKKFGFNCYNALEMNTKLSNGKSFSSHVYSAASMDYFDE